MKPEVDRLRCLRHRPFWAPCEGNAVACAVVGIYAGQEDNEFFRRTEQSLVGSGGRSLRVSDTRAIGDDTIHTVDNPLSPSARCLRARACSSLLEMICKCWSARVRLFVTRQEPRRVGTAYG